MLLEIYKDDDSPLYVQIVEALRARVGDGRLRPGDRLPSVRKLSDQLGVNPATIVAAYNILAREGLLEARKGSGAYISAAAAASQPLHEAASSAEASPLRQMVVPDSFGSAGHGQNPARHILDLAANAPPRRLFPLASVKKLLVEAVDIDGGKAFEYQTVNGYEPLRSALADRMSRQRRLPVHPDTVHVVSGAQQGIDLVARVVLRRGDLAVVESPGYRGVRDVFIAAGARVEAVSVQADGLDLDTLQSLAENRPLRLVYVNPVLQNPTGIVWSEDKKTRLAEMAGRYGFYVIEDDLFSDLMYNGRPELPVKYYDRADMVFYIKSFSKSLMPGLRIAAVQSPVLLQERLRIAKHSVDLSSNGLMQRVLERFLSGSLYDAHLASVQKAYQALRNDCEQELSAGGLPSELWSNPLGGLNLWLRLPDYSPNAGELSRKLAEQGVLLAPEAQFRCELPPASDRHVRLSFGSLDHNELRQAMTLLTNTLQGDYRHA
ncbi:MAG: PLP-dependent aminotransferase family protein [Spirochaetes bacterium]|nr:PLP-dependent aminotransferase family protein [Spirochaetota bacterium]